MTGERGFTIIELMAAVALAAVVVAAASGLTVRVITSSAETAAYLDDVEQCRRAVRAIADDLRSGAGVVTIPGGLRVVGGAHPVRYALAAGVLTRTVARRSAVVARRIGGLDVRTDGRLARLRLELMRRRTAGDRPGAVVATTVCLRGGAR
jgi:prepilin-type N-terminal cleavage/methylation domain-containing protein